jgi:hypothetical protein
VTRVLVIAVLGVAVAACGKEDRAPASCRTYIRNYEKLAKCPKVAGSSDTLERVAADMRTRLADLDKVDDSAWESDTIKDLVKFMSESCAKHDQQIAEAAKQLGCETK